MRKREGIVFEGRAKSLSSFNEVGPFDILPLHTNFVSVIKDKMQIVKENNRPFQIELKRGILRVKQNQVEVYLGI
jgi:F0F1-type ATP synthase epsilon subunit